MSATTTISLKEHSNQEGGRNFQLALRSMKRYKHTTAYHDELRQAVKQADLEAVHGRTEGERRSARLRAIECQTELDLLLTGEGADAFHGLVRFQMPETI